MVIGGVKVGAGSTGDVTPPPVDGSEVTSVGVGSDTVSVLVAFGVGVGAGSNGSLDAPSTRRRRASSCVASATIGSPATDAVGVLALRQRRRSHGLRVLGEHERQRGRSADEEERHRPQPATDQLAPGVGDDVHRTEAPVVVAEVVGGVVGGVLPPLVEAWVAAGAVGEAPPVTPWVGGTR